MGINYNKSPVNFMVEYMGEDKLKKINKERLSRGKFKIGYHNLLGRIGTPGYLTQMSKNKNNDLFFVDNIPKRMVLDDIKVNSYCFRESAIMRHDNMFNDDQQIIGYHNGELLTKDNFDKKTNNMYQHLKNETNNPDANVQLAVLAIDPQLTKQMKGKISQEDMYKMMEGKLKEFTEANNYNFDNIDYFMSLHTDKKHLHMHIVYLEKVKERKRGKLTLEENSERIRDDMTKWITAKIGERSYEKIELDKNLISKLKNDDVKMDPNLFNELQHCNAKKVGYIKPVKLKNQLLEYSSNLLEASGVHEMVENNYYKRLDAELNNPINLKKGGAKETMNDIEYHEYCQNKAKGYTQNEYDRLVKDTANYVYGEIPKANPKIKHIYECNDNDVRKEQLQPANNNLAKYRDEEELDKFNKKMSFQKIQFLMYASKNEMYVWKQMVRGYKKGAGNEKIEDYSK